MVENLYKCKFCNGASRKQIIKVREMMFGSREEFDYIECGQCGSLQINEIPPNLIKYYPSNYLSFSIRQENLIKRWLKNNRFRSSFTGKGLLGKILNEIWWMPPVGRFLNIADIKYNDTILDYGCGEGELLFQMHNIGFNNLIGIDPFIESDKRISERLILRKGHVNILTEEFDLIMFNHSLEHVSNPQEVLSKVSKHLKKNKLVMIRIPVVGGFAWRKYGANWVQLDAPRHLGIPSIAGIKHLASQTELSLEKIIFESWEFQFWGSEQFINDIPLYDSRSHWLKSKDTIFSKQQLKEFKEQAKELNEANDGDMACFFLRKN